LRLQAGSIPQLQIESPEELAGARARLASFDMGRLRGVIQLVGLTDAGGPIRVVLIPESYPLAKRTPPPTAGYAVPDENLIVLFPARSPRYPHDTLEDVLHHEMAHILMARAAHGAGVPTWFHEGLAVVAERTWGLEDQARLLSELILVSRTPLDQVDAMFASDEGSKARAYTLAAAFVRDLMRRHGADAPANILRRLRDGEMFERAFAMTTGESVAQAENIFWNSHRFWTSIGPFLTTQTALWMAVTVVAVLAIIRRRMQRAARRARWEKEDSGEESSESRDS
jgi:peptidase MA superfamily protein